jgi:hypothetical protein
MDFYDENKKKLPDLDKFQSSKDNFLMSIESQAHSRMLSDAQVETATRRWEKLKDPPVWINFSSQQAGVLIQLCDILMAAQGRYASPFIFSVREQVHKKGKLTQKQYAALLKVAEHFKKAVMKRIWTSPW